MKDIYLHKDIRDEIKDVDRKTRTISGYFSIFNNKDADGDIILPGAFKKSISERGPKSNRPRIKWFIDHDPTQVPGVLQELYEDSKGLGYVGQTGTHYLGLDFVKMVESKIIQEASIGYKPIDQEKRKDANYMRELMLWEGSNLKAWGSNELAGITGIKGLVDMDYLADRITRLEKFCKDTDCTDETIELLLLQIKQMHQHIITIKSTEPEQSTPPLNVFSEDTQKSITEILKNIV